MSDLTLPDFLRARLDEDEVVARAAFEAAEREPVSLRPVEGAQTAGALSVMEMMVRWHPARVLADVEAKRRIVGLHDQAVVASDLECAQCGWSPREAEGCDTLLLLALPHADHPDYDERWRP